MPLSSNEQLYLRSDLVDLRSFADRRGIDVQTHLASSTEGLKQAYTEALKQADEDRTFDFLTMLPEIRTRIYEELLIMDDTFTCYPNILLTCKAIEQEGSPILYGWNFLEIQLHDDGVYVHGERCGPKITRDFQRLHKKPPGNRHVPQNWPPMLRKAQWIRVSMIDAPARRSYHVISGSPIGVMYYVLYSLCSWLRERNSLRSLQVDLGEVRKHVPNLHGIMERYESQLPIALYPLRLIQTIPVLEVEGLPEDLETILMPSENVTNLMSRISAGDTEILLKTIRSMEPTLRALAVRRYGQYIVAQRQVTKLIKAQKAEKEYDFDGLIKLFLKTANMIRNALERTEDYLPSEQLKIGLQEVVQLDVEVKMWLDQPQQSE